MTRLSLAGSSGSLGPTNASRLPLPLVSITSAVQPCDATPSCVSRNCFVFSQPTTPPPSPGPPALIQSVLLASWPKYRWWVEKQVLIMSHLPVAGPKRDSWRTDVACGSALAEGWLEPCLQ